MTLYHDKRLRDAITILSKIQLMKRSWNEETVSRPCCCILRWSLCFSFLHIMLLPCHLLMHLYLLHFQQIHLLLRLTLLCLFISRWKMTLRSNWNWKSNSLWLMNSFEMIISSLKKQTITCTNIQTHHILKHKKMFPFWLWIWNNL